jgi:hypothetical protein
MLFNNTLYLQALHLKVCVKVCKHKTSFEVIIKFFVQLNVIANILESHANIIYIIWIYIAKLSGGIRIVIQCLFVQMSQVLYSKRLVFHGLNIAVYLKSRLYQHICGCFLCIYLKCLCWMLIPSLFCARCFEVTVHEKAI